MVIVYLNSNIINEPLNAKISTQITLILIMIALEEQKPILARKKVLPVV